MPWPRNLADKARSWVLQKLGPPGGAPFESPDDEAPARPQGPPAPPFPAARPSGLGEVKARLEWAGRNMRVLIIDYVDIEGVAHGHRDVEPYSFRYRAAKDKHIPLFFGFCRMHQEIHAFKLQGIQDVQFKAETFQPRWTVEF